MMPRPIGEVLIVPRRTAERTLDRSTFGRPMFDFCFLTLERGTRRWSFFSSLKTERTAHTLSHQKRGQG